MLHDQERNIARVEAAFSKEYPNAARALDALNRRWNHQISGSIFASRWLDEFGTEIDNGTAPGQGVTIADNVQTKITERFQFTKEQPWSWMRVDINFGVRFLTTGSTTYPANDHLNVYVLPTYPGQSTESGLALTGYSPGWQIGRPYIRSKELHDRTHITLTQICKTYPYEGGNFNSHPEEGGNSDAPQGFPAGTYGAEVWMFCDSLEADAELQVNRLSCFMQEIHPTPMQLETTEEEYVWVP